MMCLVKRKQQQLKELTELQKKEVVTIRIIRNITIGKNPSEVSKRLEEILFKTVYNGIKIAESKL